MATSKKPAPAAKKGIVSKAPAKPATTTAVRNTAIPKVTAKKEITREMISKRAYEIWQSGKGGSETENWTRAERELRGV